MSLNWCVTRFCATETPKENHSDQALTNQPAESPKLEDASLTVPKAESLPSLWAATL